MKITEKLLLDNYSYTCNGGSKVSAVAGQHIWWEYRTGQDSDGYNPVCCSRESASGITLEYGRDATIGLGDHADHPALSQIASDEAAMWGSEVANA